MLVSLLLEPLAMRKLQPVNSFKMQKIESSCLERRFISYDDIKNKAYYSYQRIS